MKKIDGLEAIENCPLCDLPGAFFSFMDCRDHLVSGEVFSLCRCTNCGLVFTNPRPREENAERHYQSEKYISHTDSQKGTMEKVYHLVRKHMLKKKLGMLKHTPSQNKTLLDVGCGTGAFLEAAQNEGFLVKGFEPGEKPRETARRKGLDVMGDKKELKSLKEGSFQVVTLWHVLEHMPDFLNKMKHFSRLLKTGGLLVVAVPMYKSFDAGFYKNFWAGWDLPRHLFHFDHDTIKLSAQKSGFKVVKTQGLPFDSFYVSLLSEDYKKNPMGKLRAVVVGGWSNVLAFLGKKPWSSEVFILKKTNGLSRR